MAVDYPFNNYWQTGLVSNQEDDSGSKALSEGEIIDLLSEEEDEPVKNEGKEEEKGKGKDSLEDKDKEDDEGKETGEEEEVDLDEEDEGEEELDEVVVPVSIKQIEKEYPGFRKKFPQMEAAYFKSQQYAEIFPTISDAREAEEKASSLDEFSKDILSGNLETLFSTIKQNAPKTMGKIADNLIQTISRVDESTALHITGNILRVILRKAESDGIKTKNEDLQTAAKIINQHILGDDEIRTPNRLEVKEDPREEELNKERQEFEQERFDNALSTLQTRVDNTIKSAIDANIDKTNVMTSYIKKNAINDAFEKVEELIEADKSFQKILNNLWRAANDAKYSSSSLDKIRSAYLSKAKTMLPEAIRSARAEALKGFGKRSNEDKDRKGPLPAHRSSASSKETGSKGKEIPKGMSIKDYIMAD